MLNGRERTIELIMLPNFVAEDTVNPEASDFDFLGDIMVRTYSLNNAPNVAPFL